MVIHGEDFSMDGKLLGSGSQGEVFKIIHVKSGVVYAVKIVRLENTEAKKMMDHEITILKTISSFLVHDHGLLRCWRSKATLSHPQK
jgi:serine/threonine protein kinase